MTHADPLLAAADFGAAAEIAGVPYLVVGSVAALFHGEPRLTVDVDVVIAIAPRDVARFAAILAREFLVDPAAIADAARNHSSFNALHQATMMKVDVYVRERVGHTAEELRRGRPRWLLDDPLAATRVCTAEDLALRKLVWYRSGGEASERQWRDVMGVLKRQGERFDLDYARHWAGELGVADLLVRALRQLGRGPQ